MRFMEFSNEQKVQLIESIKSMVSYGHIEAAISFLIDLSERAGNTTYINQALLLSSRFKKEKFNLLNGLSDDKFEMNRITFSILEICDEISGYFSINKQSMLDHINYGKNKNDEDVFEKFVGMKILNYTITEFIHAGGFGAVYKAVHNKLGNIVAIKITYEIDEGFGFLDDIMSVGITGLQLLNHKYIIKIIDMGEILIEKSMRIFIIMEYISGGSLADLRKDNLNEEEVLNRIDIFKKVCRGILYSHNIKYTDRYGFQHIGLMHGDIKPMNILLTKAGDPKIMDFMFVDMRLLVNIKLKLPRVIEEWDGVTKIFGTEGYMPLEQKIEGIVTVRTDIYSLGVLLFELLSPIKFSISEFTTLSKRSTERIHIFLSQNCQKLPKYVSKIIYKATQDSEFERYQNVSEIITEIENGDPWYQKFIR
jgi:serine/threonine protein kinase